MKTLTKALGLLTIVFGLSITVNSVSASPANSLQPASSLVVEDELEVSGTTRTYSIRIGAQGYGGVTFFNGTIINETTDADTGAEMPVTFGDDIRIDGSLWRGENAGVGLDDSRELTVNDDMIVSGALTVNDLLGTGVVSTGNILDGTITSADIANNAVTGAKIAAGTIVGSDISSSTNLSVDTGTFTGAVTTGALTSSTGTFSGDITASGDINQDLTDHGAVKALVNLDGATGNCNSSWTYNDSAVTCTPSGSTGVYDISFDSSFGDLISGGEAAVFWQITPSNIAPRIAAVPSGTVNSIQIVTYDIAGLAADTDLMLTIY
ncbi:MAG: hypothetical protein HQ538_07135 [Parcubacteria group bacterium]|nr:hypothetical protein [Parcubacteria group bacterium]